MTSIVVWNKLQINVGFKKREERFHLEGETVRVFNMSAGLPQHLGIYHLKIILIFKIRLFVIPPIQPVVYEWPAHCMVTCEVILDHDGVFPAFQFIFFSKQPNEVLKLLILERLATVVQSSFHPKES